MPLIKISKSNIPDTLNFRDSIFVPNDTTIKGDLYVDGNIFGNLADAPTPAAHDHNYTDPLFRDATTKRNLVVEGNLSVLGNLLFTLDDFLVQSDATIKDDLRVEGLIFGTLADAPAVGPEAQDFKIFKDLIVQDDATVKDTLYLDGFLDLRGTSNIDHDALVNYLAGEHIGLPNTIATVLTDHDAGAHTEAQDFKIFKDLVVQDDATVKGDVYVDGNLFGGNIDHDTLVNYVAGEHIGLPNTIATVLTDHNAAAHAESLNFKVGEDLLVQDDATVKDELIVEGHLEIKGTHNISIDNASDFDVWRDLVVHDDATVKDTFRVLGHKGDPAYGASQYTLFHVGNAGVEVGGDLLVREDATVHQDLRVFGRIHPSSVDDNRWRKMDDDTTSSVTLWSSYEIYERLQAINRWGHSQFYSQGESPDFSDVWILKDLVVQDDATVKDDLIVEGLIFGTLADPPAAGAHDHNYSTPIFHDTTIKHNLNVELGHIQGKIGRLDLQGLDSASEVKLIGPGVNNKIEIAANIFRVELGGSEHFVIDQTLGVFRSMSNEVIFAGTTGWGLITYGLARFHDATVKTVLSVEGRAEINNNLLVNGDLFIYRDATVKDDLRVEGLIFGTLADAPTPAAHDHDYSDPVFDDATIKGSLIVEGPGPGSAIFIQNESPPEDIDGATTSFSTSNKFEPGSLEVFLNGLRLKKDVDFSEGADYHRYDMTRIPADGNIIVVDYLQKAGTVNANFYEVHDSTATQTRLYSAQTFTKGNNGLQVYVNGLLQRIGEDYTEESDDLIVFTSALGHNDKVTLFVPGSISIIDIDAETDDFMINKDLLVRDDATVKDHLYVEKKAIICGSIFIPGASPYIETVTLTHKNDVNTYIQFGDDAINFVAGNKWMFEIFEGAPDDEIRTKEKLVTNADVWVNKGFLVQDDATIKGTLRVETQGGGNVARIKTGTYTGDGAVGQSITGVGFQPKYLRIFFHPTAEGITHKLEKLDQNWGDYAVMNYCVALNEFYVFDNRINSLDADGFTVDDDADNKSPNSVDGVYDYIAWG